MKSSRYLLNFLLSLFLCFLSIALILTAVFSCVLFNKSTYLKVIENAEVSQIIYSDIQDLFIDQSGSTNIDAEVFQGVMTKESVEEIFSQYINSALDFAFSKSESIDEIEFDFTVLESNLTDYFLQYAKEHGFAVDSAFEEQLNTTIENAKTSIKNAFDLSLFKKAAETAKPYVFKAQRLVVLAVICCLVVCLFICFLLFLLNRKFTLYWIFSSLSCASLIVFTGFSLLRFSGFFEGFILANKILHSLVTEFLFFITDIVLIISFICLVISITILVLCILKIKKQKGLQQKSNVV